MRKWISVFLFLIALPAGAKEWITPSGVKVEAEHPTWQYVEKVFTLPSGLKYASLVLIPIAQAEEDIPLVQEIKIWIKSFANQYGVSAENMEKLAECESNYDVSVVGDAGLAMGLYQWHQTSWDFYNKKFKTELHRGKWQDQIVMTARVLSEKDGYYNWLNCWKFLQTGSWNFLKK